MLDFIIIFVLILNCTVVIAGNDNVKAKNGIHYFIAYDI